MQLKIRFKGVEADGDLVHHIERHLRFALDRFEERVRRVQVTLVDENGNKGGVDTRCRILLALCRGAPLVIDSRSHDPYQAVVHAARRAGHTLAKRMSRRVDRRRRRDPLLVQGSELAQAG